MIDLGRATVGLAVLSAALTGCSDARPCSDCPAVEGTYDMAYAEQSRLGSCAIAPPPAPAALELTRVGSTVRVANPGLDLVGTLFDTWDFTLLGGHASDGGTPDGREVEDTISARGHFVPPGADGGAAIRGTWDTSTLQTSAAGSSAECSVSLAFTGKRR